VVPAPTAACVNGSIGSNNTTTNVPAPTRSLPDGTKYQRYCSLSLTGNVIFPPGVYIVDGQMSSNGQSISGTGVTFVLMGSVNLSGNVTLNLSAPTSGPYSGLVFFGDRDATLENVQITGTSASVVQGAVYFPTGTLDYTGNSSTTNGCTQVIANTITFSGNSSIKSSCTGIGTRTFSLGSSVALVE
jgi:hypothetical protein